MSSQKTGLLLIGVVLVSVHFSSIIAAQEKIISNDTLSFQRDLKSKKLRMLRGTSTGLPIRKQANEPMSDSVRRQFAPYFGMNDPTKQLIVKKESFPSVQRQNIRYQQHHQGIPVIAGELVANLDNQQLNSMSGEVSQITLTDLQPRVTATQASDIAKTAVAKWYNLDINSLVATQAELSIYDPALLTPSDAPQVLTWKLSVRPEQLLPINEFILINAHNGVINLHFNQIDTALSRATYTANNLKFLPGTLVCNETDTACAAGDSDAKNAHRYAADTYNYYLSMHGRNSLDGNGITLKSSVHYDLPIGTPGSYSNAFFDTSTNVAGFTDQMAVDDVVAHEFTHGVTAFTSGLVYYYQSGAINESLSDIWGEFVDLGNGAGSDLPENRWQIGEDTYLGAIRNMRNPTLFGDPDKMTSPNYDFAPNDRDNGGVHANSGINNKAVYLMVDGGNFNGRNVSGIGITKVAKIYYEVQTNYLTTGSDYLDLYNALNQACQSLIGTYDINSDDCAQVKNAIDAVEMNLSPLDGFRPKAEICPAGSAPVDVLFDNFETNLSRWTSSNFIGVNSWERVTGYATSGTVSVLAPGTEYIHDMVLTLNNPVSIPTAETYYLHFNHFFIFDSGNGNKDGGVIEYSTDNGITWLDAGNLIDAGREYTGALALGNPLEGRQAFTSNSHGYNSTRLNLSSLAGEDFRFRFRSTADDNTISQWTLDDVRIYTCNANSRPSANAGTARTVNASTIVNLDGTASNDADGDALSYQWTQTAGPAISLSGATSTTPSFTAPGAMANLVFRLTVTDTFDQSAVATVSITVDGPPTANAGNNQTVNSNMPVTLNGSGSSDPEGGVLGYSWMQTAGTNITLQNPSLASPSFTAPASFGTLTFRLTVTDNRSQTATDTVVITVQDTPAPSSSNSGSNSSGGCTFSANGRFDPIWVSILLLLSLIHLQRRFEN